jgi:hypothetical protein
VTKSKKNVVLAAMVLAVGMTFIHQTIVAIASPSIGGKLADVVGRRRVGRDRRDRLRGDLGPLRLDTEGQRGRGVAAAWVVVLRLRRVPQRA